MMEKIKGPNEQIYLTENREILALKLEEYKKRIDEFRAPELQYDALYKIAVLEPLVQTGVVNRSEVAESLTEKYGSLDAWMFENAWVVIEDYSLTGGAHTTGGTGLPKSENPESDETIH